ncbi:hypothetical protein Hanom_Chr14g01286461 [Helianthus anomalus]
MSVVDTPPTCGSFWLRMLGHIVSPKHLPYPTRLPKSKPTMTLVAMEMAASSRSPRCPAKACVMTNME